MKKVIVGAFAITLTVLTFLMFSDRRAPYSKGVTIFVAETIVTVDASLPIAKAVAVENDRVVAVGSVGDLTQQFPNAELDIRFRENTLIPGLIDPHVHMILGSIMYALDFIPPWDMETPDGIVKGLPTKERLLAAISKYVEIGEKPLILYGYHNLVQGDLTRQDLDAISQSRPLFIWHYSGHDFYLNSAAIELAGLDPSMADDFHGIGLDAFGKLNGRIYEDALPTLLKTVGPILLNPRQVDRGWNGYEEIFSRSGITTVAEMGYGIFGQRLEDAYRFLHYRNQDNYRLYLVPEHRAFAEKYGEKSATKILNLAAKKKRRAPVLPKVKLFSDGAFYSQTMKMSAPGYIAGQSRGSDGLWVTDPNNLPALMKRYWDVGLGIHIHSNGDASQDSTLSSFEMQKQGVDGQRLIIEHAGVLTPDQILDASRLGIGISAASHYVRYMGEDYIGSIAEKSEFITPLRSATEMGIPVTMHSDAPLAPPNPLKAAGVHMTRMTRQGTISNADETLTADQALKAITLNAAWALGLEDELGSISVGKKADFTVLGANPLDTPGEDWGKIPIWGVVLNGRPAPIN